MANHHKFENSSSLTHCDYHEKDGHLEIGFQSGKSYRYECGREHYEALKSAASPGKHFHSVIRGKVKEVK